ncbi:MAG: HAD-IIA family hydrolase [Proteobacteria bacterium]|nr:HAD-IIA family hydrolase [Pseudomonadota bacterium]
MRIEASFLEIASAYRFVFLDAYGVLKNSTGMIQGAAETLLKLGEQGSDCYVITNDASRSPGQMARSYCHPRYGELVPVEHIISSGMLASDFLASKVRPGRVAYVGKPSSAYYIESAGHTPLPVAQCADDHAIDALVLLDDEGFDWFSDINRCVNLLRRQNVPVVVANTDLSYPASETDVSIAVGSLANMIEGIIQKTFIRFGKPDTQIFDFAYDLVLTRDPLTSKKQVLMVGDTLHTDILGGNKFGIDTLLVLSGNTQERDAEVRIHATGILPNFVCASIAT